MADTTTPSLGAGFYGDGKPLTGPQGPTGNDGAQGPAGPVGPQGPGPTTAQLNDAAAQALAANPAPKGDKGDAATITIAGVSTANPGSPATVTNAGDSQHAQFVFSIPQGAKGDTGLQGPQGVQGPKGDPGANTTAAAVTADDGSSGALFSSVQGFLSRLPASSGSAMVGWGLSSVWAVTRPVSTKLGEMEVSLKDFGAVADSTSYFTGTDNRMAIQQAINFVWLAGGGTVKVPPVAQPLLNTPIESRVAYGFTGFIIIPSNVRIAGGGMGLSGFRRINGSTGMGFAVGTYGPSNTVGASLADNTKYTITDISASAGPLQNYVTLATPSEAGNFAIGDVVALEGSQTNYGRATQYLPNLAIRVTGVNTSTGVVSFDCNLDDGDGYGYVTLSGVAPGIRKTQNDSAHWLGVDATGRQWTLFAAVNAGMRDLFIDEPRGTGWAAINLSTFECQFENLELNGKYLAGNPCARTTFRNIRMKYTNAAIELAFLSHDTNFYDCSFFRDSTGIADFNSAGLVWVNFGEGGKRINFYRFKLIDRADVTSSTVVGALSLRKGCVMEDVLIVIPKGTLGYLQGGVKIRNFRMYCNATGTGSNYGLTYGANDELISGHVRAIGVVNCALLAGPNSRTVNVDVGDFSNAPASLLTTDFISTSSYAIVTSCRSALSYGYGRIDTNAFVRSITATATVTGGNVSDVPAIPRKLGAYWMYGYRGWFQIGSTSTGKFKLITSLYNSSGTLVPLVSIDQSSTALPAGLYRFEMDVTAVGPGTSNFFVNAILRNSAGAVVAARVAEPSSIGLNNSDVCGFNIAFTGLTSGDVINNIIGNATFDPLYNN
jgi:hypothetical protein